jgi:hypothetical protein
MGGHNVKKQLVKIVFSLLQNDSNNSKSSYR